MEYNDKSALLTDFYSLTMAQGYWRKGMDNKAVFEMFFRHNPFDGGFSVFAGLGTLLERLSTFTFSKDDLDYLRGLGTFDEGFLEYLADFRFGGDLWAMDEGTIVFPQEPLIRVEGGLIECQLIEGMLLNIINFQSLISTKAARVWLATGKGRVMEFGLRRAQGPDGAMSASRAAFIGGASGTSNVLAGKAFGIPVMGTMAHSWVMAFPSELEAFQAYADIYPDKTIFLIDTYDTLKSGAPNAIKVGKKLAAKGQRFGVRLDSGDIQYLSVEVRRMLDDAGLEDAYIAVSNDLDELIIQTLTGADAPVDTWGVGTRMVTGGDEAAFTGVYKLAAREREGRLEATIKFSDNPDKTTNPGPKQVWRIKDRNGMAVADILSLDMREAGLDIIERNKRYCFWHTSADYRHFVHTLEGSAEALLKPRLAGGRVVSPGYWLGGGVDTVTSCWGPIPVPSSQFPGSGAGEPEPLTMIQERVRLGLEAFDQSYKRILNPHIYKVSITEKLRNLKLELIGEFLGGR